MACTTSTYGADSFTNRWPAPLTSRQPGRLRSARQKYGPPGSGIDGPHQASSISPGAAPSPDHGRLTVAEHPDAGDPAVGHDQAGQRRIEPDRHAAGGQPGPQPGD